MSRTRAVAGRARKLERRPAGVHRAIGAGGCGRGSGRRVFGSTRQSRQSAFRWRQCPSPRAIRRAAREAERIVGAGAPMERRGERTMSLETARRVLKIEAQAIADVLARLDATFERAGDALFACTGRVGVTGMGKSGLIGRNASATLARTGTPSRFLHPAEALQGDLGMLVPDAVLVAITSGGCGTKGT